MSETWEFRALRKIAGKSRYYAGDFRIGYQTFRDAMVATGFPGFVQIPEVSFERLVRLGYISGAVPIQEYIRRAEAQPSDYSHPAFTIGGRVDRGEFGLGLEVEREDTRGVGLLWGERNPARLLTQYPSTRVGNADVCIQGVNDTCVFSRAPVMAGGKTLLWLGMLHELSRISVNPEELYGYVVVK